MYKRTFALIGFLCCVLLPVFAGGRQANQSHEVENPAGFTEFINIEDKAHGMWNIFLEARDGGGNTFIAGPHNIFIDPRSDLPIARVINPWPNMHVQGNLNIVGTSADDDEVAYTVLRINWGAGDGGELMHETRATGTDFWFYSLDTSDTERWLDGIYTVTAWAVDVNGLSGISEDFHPRDHRRHQVVWNLDRRRPEITITSHELGALVNGRVSIRGTVWDGNDISSLSFSTDEGETYQPVRIRRDRRSGIYNFDFTIDTRAFDDGPQVILLRARDGMGTEGALSFLLFVNNTPPEVDIVHPAPGEAVNGIFSVAGYAMHNVGLASLSWRLGRDSGEIDMIKGNPWWVREFDIRGQNLRSLDLEITAIDLSGNRTVVRRRLPVDQDADRPRVILNEPGAGTVVLDTGLRLSGTATDDDGVAAVLYSWSWWDSGREPAQVPASGHFQLILEDIPPGVHTLEVWARDITGIEGPREIVRGIVSPGIAPEVTTEFYSGIEVSSESGSALRFVVQSGSSLQSLNYQLGSRPPVEIPVRGSRGGEFTAAIPIPLNIDYGLVRLEITATDIHGRGEPFVDFIRVTDYSAPRVIDGHIPVNRLTAQGVSLTGLDGQSPWPEQIRAARGARIPINAAIDPAIAQGARAVFTLRSIIEGQERPPINGSVGRDGTVSANLPANLTPDLYRVTLTVTPRDAAPLEVIGEFWLLRPDDGRLVNTAERFDWVRPDTAGDGRILLLDGESLVGIYNGRPLTGAAIVGAAGTSFDVRLDDRGRVVLSGLADGNHSLRLNLTDRDGRTFTTDEHRFLVSGSVPDLELVDNPDGQWLQDTVTARFRMGSRIGISAVEHSIDLGRSWHMLLQPNEIAGFGPNAVIERSLNIAAIEDGAVSVSIRVTDQAGRQTVQSFMVHKDTTAPEARLVVPISGARVNGRIRLGITIQEAGSLASIFYERPGGAGALQIYPDPERDVPLRFLYVELDDTMPLLENMRFVFTDMSGNTSVLSDWHFVIDSEMDLPVVHISLPIEDEVITSDFVVSGVCFDDDEVSRIFWRINNGEERSMEAVHGFSISVPLSSVTDNENSVTIFAEDIWGVRGEPVTRNFRVSLEEPTAIVINPELGEILGGLVHISGTASDQNRIGRVQVSLDNGITFNTAEIANNVGTTAAWNYVFNSKILPDGPSVVFVRVWDSYEITALYASMLVIDNTPPELVIETPLDGAQTTGPIIITGRAVDEQILESVVIRVSSLQGVNIPPALAQINARLDSILLENVDLGVLPNGTYNVEVFATDRAGNVSQISRNVLLDREGQRNFVDILYPLSGEFVRGSFNLYGNTGGIDTAAEVTLMVNGHILRTEPVSNTGFYRFALGAEDLLPGTNELMVFSNFGGVERVESVVRTIEYYPYGPWITVDTISMGDFVYERPWLMGRVGYALSEEDLAVLQDRNADREIRNALRERTPSRVELSFDNGRSFVATDNVRRGDYDWRFRLETQDMAEGLHYLIARATMQNGETASTRLLVQVDNTPPEIRLISPESGGRFNERLEFTALASDNVELVSLTYHLRRGNWALYEVPGFIRGLYVESTIPPFVWMFGGNAPGVFVAPTFFDVGLGLSFFDDNVKLQFNYGRMTQSWYESLGGEGLLRYGGHVLGFKLLANVYSLPFSMFLGPDWHWLSATFALGANFSLFDLAQEGYTQSGQPTWMSALLLQIEFPRVTLPGRTSFRTFSFFTEGQLWFVPTDADTDRMPDLSVVFPKIITGLRLYIF